MLYREMLPIVSMPPYFCAKKGGWHADDRFPHDGRPYDETAR